MKKVLNPRAQVTAMNRHRTLTGTRQQEHKERKELSLCLSEVIAKQERTLGTAFQNKDQTQRKTKNSGSSCKQ